ncbi:DUF6447 family protein [Ectothiorhodospira variabilis]|uniref:DUF6447 family protein n=1 Tax=Ectothiorhodospira variabilis TaxID=505694 RepID=UPI001EFA9769|nr:DUF6447 family protein [Ectothiorhodospira variabilis]MCG5495848.1 DUF6447 family protein [Ectothiorhodospira variabilis]MCG5504549.1 DUF6447 family protein [Ectothiorhodospira variabilis]MCG5507744.1 DUF6447 family protein [Ectothiorhodospira variabilis]
MAETTNPSMITIDGKQYDVNDLSENAKSQIANLRVTDQEIQRLNQQLAIAQTARAAYARALEAELPKTEQ